MAKKKEEITKQLKGMGFSLDGDMMHIPLPGNNKWLVYKPTEKKLYLSNVYLNFLRDIKTVEQVNAVYQSLTDKSLLKNKTHGKGTT